MWFRWVVAAVVLTFLLSLRLSNWIHNEVRTTMVELSKTQLLQTRSINEECPEGVPTYTMYRTLQLDANPAVQRRIVHVEVGEPLRLALDGQNLEKVGVYRESECLGYLDPETAQTISRLLSQRQEVECYVKKITSQDGVYGLKVRITW